MFETARAQGKHAAYASRRKEIPDAAGRDAASCAVGIFLGAVARSMPQLGLLYMLVYLPMNVLSGSNTPLESMPPWLATAMQASPSTHFVSFAQSILYRVAGIDVVWLQFLLVAGIRSLFFLLAILRFRSMTSQTV